MYNTDLYDNLLQSQTQYQYSLKDKTKTMVICGAFLLNASMPIFSSPPLGNFAVNKEGSGGYAVNSLYYSDTNTWSDIKVEYIALEDDHSSIADTFSILKKLSFLESDEIAEKEADVFFSKVTIKTKKILVNKKA